LESQWRIVRLAEIEYERNEAIAALRRILNAQTGGSAKQRRSQEGEFAVTLEGPMWSRALADVMSVFEKQTSAAE
jgi:hypothetical protein